VRDVADYQDSGLGAANPGFPYEPVLYQGGAVSPVATYADTVPGAAAVYLGSVKRLARLGAPALRVRYLPTPRLRACRPNVGRSVRGRRVRASSSSRGSPRRSRADDGDPHEHKLSPVRAA
jgi:hypothetical protein